jgi:hypothetical protein
MMTIVERIIPGFQWAEPLVGQDLEVQLEGSDLKITGLFPQYTGSFMASDLLAQFENYRTQIAIGQERTGTFAPDVMFANADTEEKLISFVRRFGPVVARRVFLKVGQESRIYITAYQDLQELRNEQKIYRAALALIMELSGKEFHEATARQHIKAIVTHVSDWPRQWEREKTLEGVEPTWRLSIESLNRIEQLSLAPPDQWLPPYLDGRIVMCALLNSFHGLVFPNLIEMHNSIQFGVRPLLYSLLRRQFVDPRAFAACRNSACRNFFNIERVGQSFCSARCSLQHRQRAYWQQAGKKRRKERILRVRKMERAAEGSSIKRRNPQS